MKQVFQFSNITASRFFVSHLTISMTQKGEVPQFIRGKDILIASSYRRNDHLREVKEASFLFASIGLNVYPHHSTQPVNLEGGFVFLGGGEIEYSKVKIERYFLEGIKKAQLLYVIPKGGYLGKSSSIETAYGLAVETPVFFSEQIREFGREVPFSMQSIILSHPTPVVPPADIQRHCRNIIGFARDNRNLPNLSDQQKRQVFSSILELMRSLR